MRPRRDNALREQGEVGTDQNDLHTRNCNNIAARGVCMNDEAWLQRLRCLCERFSHLGIGTDLAGLSMIELWGLYCYLTRLVDS